MKEGSVKGRDAKQKQESWNFRIEHTTGIVSFVLERQEQRDIVRSYSISSILASDNPHESSPSGKYRPILCRGSLDASANSINSQKPRKKFLSPERKRGDSLNRQEYFFSAHL